MHLIKSISTFIILIALISCTPDKQKPTAEAPNNPLIGSWQISSIYWITADTTYAIEKAQPGLFMVNPTNYSIMWTPTPTPRTPFENLSKPTDEETIAGFRSIVFNAGTYTQTDSTLTTTAQIAKVPGFEGGVQYYRYHIKEDQLELTMFDETYPDGSKPDWYGKYQTKFVMSRVR